MLSSQFLEIIASNNKMRAMSLVTWAYGIGYWELERGPKNIGKDGWNYKEF